MKTIFERITKKQDQVNARIKEVIGKRIVLGGDTWEFVGANDIYYPYFAKVVNNKSQKKQFTISGFDRDWLLNLI